MFDRIPVTLFEKIAQLIFIRIGSNMSPQVRAEDDAGRIEELLRDCPIGGLVLFNGTYGVTRSSLSRLQEKSRFPMLVCADLERGAGQQLHGATVFPHAMSLMVGDDREGDAETMGRITAQEALSSGVHMILGPVADVHSNPRNPIIGTRSFGRDPARVAALVSAYIRGCHDAGALVATKHFPGHGNTDTDSHSDVPVIPSSREDMDWVELVPFRAAVAAGTDAVMTAHAVFPEVDDSGKVATASHAIIEDLLRIQCQFEGVVVSDSLLMDGVRDNYPSEAEMAIDLLFAGQEILLDVSDPRAIVSAVIRAVESEQLDESVIDRAFRKVWGLKEQLSDRFGAQFFLNPVLPSGDLSSGEADLLAHEIARRGTEVIARAKGRFVSDSPLLFVLIKPFRTHLDPPLEPLGDLVRARFGRDAYFQVEAETSPEELDKIRNRSLEGERLVLAVIMKPAAWHAFGLPEHLRNFVTDLACREYATILFLGSPDAMDLAVSPSTVVCTYSDVSVSQRAAFEFVIRDALNA